MPLLSEINTPAIEERVLRAARFRRLGVYRGRERRYQADYEHGQWWVTELESGAQWSVVTCGDGRGNNYLDFEQVTTGDETR